MCTVGGTGDVAIAIESLGSRAQTINCCFVEAHNLRGAAILCRVDELILKFDKNRRICTVVNDMRRMISRG